MTKEEFREVCEGARITCAKYKKMTSSERASMAKTQIIFTLAWECGIETSEIIAELSKMHGE